MQTLPTNGGTIQVCTAPRRLMNLNAGLFILGSPRPLHQCDPNDWHHCCDLIYTIGLGKPVLLASKWREIGGNPANLTANTEGLITHTPAVATGQPCNFVLTREFKSAYPELHFALEHCAGQPKSQWNVCVASQRRAATLVDLHIKSISELAGAILKRRKLGATGGRGYALGDG